MTGDFTNTALKRLRGGDSLSCVWLSLGSVAVAEIAAECLPDVIVFDGQHGLWERTTLHAAISAAMINSTPIVRVAANAGHLIGEALDSGAQGVIVPLVESSAQAAAAVAAAHFPPHGNRSGGGVRPLANFGAYSEACATQVLVSVMIETQVGLANAREIISTKGVDMVFIGPGDLALSLSPDGASGLEDAIQMILDLCRSMGVPCGLFTGSVEDAQRRRAEGFAFVVAEDDIRLIRNGMARSLSAVERDIA